MSNLVQQAVRDGELFAADSHVLVACSGGVDSMVLGHALAMHGGLQQVSLCYVDHGLQSASEAQWIAVQALATEVGVVAYRESVDAKRVKAGRGPEDGARQERYRCLERLRVCIGADRIALGHHADDQVETFLIRLSQGSGMHGLRGMQKRVGVLVRPFLGLVKADLQSYADRHSLDIVADPSNTSAVYLRNAVRAQVMPSIDSVMGPHWRQHTRQLMEEFAQRSSFDQSISSQLFERFCMVESTGILIKRSGFLTLSAHEQYLLARSCLTRQLSDGLVRRQHLQRLVEELSNLHSTTRWQLSDALWIMGEYEHVFLGLEHAKAPAQVRLAADGPTSWGDWRIHLVQPSMPCLRVELSANRFEMPVTLRAPTVGERVSTRSGEKRISRLFIDQKVPKRLRKDVLVIDADGVEKWVWLPNTEDAFVPAEGVETVLWIVPPREFKRWA